MPTYGAKDMAASWRTVRKNTIQIAEDIPADHYGYQATPETQTVGAILAHLASYSPWTETVHGANRMHAVTGEDFGRFMAESGQLAATLTSKDTILEALRTHGDSFAAMLDDMSDEQLAEGVTLPGGEKGRMEMLLGVKEHEMHHRAQLMVLERMLNIVPHLTRARQQRQQ